MITMGILPGIIAINFLAYRNKGNIMKNISLFIAAYFLIVTQAYASGEHCANIDRSLTSEQKAQLAPAIAKQLDVTDIEVLQSFSEGNWRIIYVGTHDSEPAFVFFNDNPIKSRYITLWGGAAGIDEEQDITNWAQKNAKGIPSDLANCFAWHVTHNRNM